MTEFQIKWEAAKKQAVETQPELIDDDPRKTLRTYKGRRKFKARKYQRNPLRDENGKPQTFNDTGLTKWAMVKHTKWFTSLRTSGMLEGK